MYNVFQKKGNKILDIFKWKLVDQLCDEYVVINFIIKLENWGFLDYKKFNYEFFLKILVNFMIIFLCILDIIEINN